MKRYLFVALACFAPLAVADDAKTELKSVQVKSVQLKLPGNWTEQRTASSMRLAQYVVPGDVGENGEFVVFYFGGGATGGVKANVERWIGQFAQDDVKLEMFQGKCAAGSYVLVDTTGTWNKPYGPPFARKTVPTPGSRVLNLILMEEKGDEKIYYFLKLSGSKEVVSKNVDALRTAIAADRDSEKEFKL